MRRLMWLWVLLWNFLYMWEAKMYVLLVFEDSDVTYGYLHTSER